MGCKSEREENISSSSSSSSDECADPDYCETPQRQLQPNSSTSLNKNKNMQIQMEIGSSSQTSGTGRRRGRPPIRRGSGQAEIENVQRARRGRDERLSLSFRRSTRRRRMNPENKNDQREIKRTILSWLIDTKVIEQNRKACFMNESREQALKEGIIRRDGILCDCCLKVFTAFDFEAHAGSGLKRPYENIFIQEPRLSLLSCMREAWNRTSEEFGRQRLKEVEAKGKATDNHDDACMICADGGNLLCCDKCPSTYHQDCMDMDEVPEDSWLCPYCVCKFCGNPCAANDYLITCFQCERRYHWECYQERNLEPIDLNKPGTPLCEHSCKEVYEKLENMVGVRKELDEGYSWTLLRRMNSEFGICLDDLYQIIECHSKLAVARNVMEECFEPVIDRHTRINIILNVVYNRILNYTRINFRGFYTAILEKDDEIISVASLRIHGTQLAEMPFIATRENYRSQGMCRRLMVAIESALFYLKVENMVIPSIHERIGTWIGGYGFQRIGSSLGNDIRHRNTLMFHDSLRLQKNLAASGGSENKPIMQALWDLNFEPPEEDEMNDE